MARTNTNKPKQIKPLRYVVSSDWHLDAITAGVERFDEISRSARNIAQYAVDVGADAFVFMGDLTNPATARAHRADTVAVQIANDLSLHGITSFWVVGNHDVMEDGKGTHTLAGVCGLTAAHVIRAMSSFKLNDQVTFLFLAYPPATLSYDIEDTIIKAIHEATTMTIVVFSHLDIKGAVPGSESNDMKRGRSVWLPWELMRDEATRWGKIIHFFNGHYHREQTIGAVRVPGSIARLRFDEESNTPGFFDVYTTTDRHSVQVVELSNVATLATWDVSKKESQPGADFVRVRGKRGTAVQAASDLLSAALKPFKVDTWAAEDEFFAKQATGIQLDKRSAVMAMVEEAPLEIRDLLRQEVERTMSKAGI